MTELRQRMMDAMMQRGFAQRTQETYVQASAPDRMCVRVASGKEGKGRYSILSPTLLAGLRHL